MTELFPNVSGDASISDCGRYRWQLTRSWGRIMDPWVCWIMLNPSIADATSDDPTIRRCMGFAKSWGYGGITVVNLFPFRATDPDNLMKSMDPDGPTGSVELIEEVAGSGVCSLIVAAWGCLNWDRAYLRSREVLKRLSTLGVELHCLGVNKDGSPKHPLYIAAATKPVPFPVIRTGTTPIPSPTQQKITEAIRQGKDKNGEGE